MPRQLTIEPPTPPLKAWLTRNEELELKIKRVYRKPHCCRVTSYKFTTSGGAELLIDITIFPHMKTDILTGEKELDRITMSFTNIKVQEKATSTNEIVSSADKQPGAGTGKRSSSTNMEHLRDLDGAAKHTVYVSSVDELELIKHQIRNAHRTNSEPTITHTTHLRHLTLDSLRYCADRYMLSLDFADVDEDIVPDLRQRVLQTVSDHKGVVHRVVNNHMVIFFGVPYEADNDMQQACKSAVEISTKFQMILTERKLTSDQKIYIGILSKMIVVSDTNPMENFYSIPENILDEALWFTDKAREYHVQIVVSELVHKHAEEDMEEHHTFQNMGSHIFNPHGAKLLKDPNSGDMSVITSMGELSRKRAGLGGGLNFLCSASHLPSCLFHLIPSYPCTALHCPTLPSNAHTHNHSLTHPTHPLLSCDRVTHDPDDSRHRDVHPQAEAAHLQHGCPVEHRRRHAEDAPRIRLGNRALPPLPLGLGYQASQGRFRRNWGHAIAAPHHLCPRVCEKKGHLSPRLGQPLGSRIRRRHHRALPGSVGKLRGTPTRVLGQFAAELLWLCCERARLDRALHGIWQVDGIYSRLYKGARGKCR